jgi:hypothetical protein
MKKPNVDFIDGLFPHNCHANSGAPRHSAAATAGRTLQDQFISRRGAQLFGRESKLLSVRNLHSPTRF